MGISLRKILLTGAVIAAAGTLSPSKNIDRYVEGTNLHSASEYEEKVTEKHRTFSPYLEFQDSTLKAPDVPKGYVEVDHEIAKGDTFFKIAKLYMAPTEYVQRLNPHIEETNMQIGDHIKVFALEESLRGYLPPTSKKNIEKNRGNAELSSPEKFLGDRNAFGRDRLAKYLGIVPGDLEYDERVSTESFEKMKPIFQKYATMYDVDYKLIAAVCKHESGFRKWTASETGSYGLCGQTKDNYGESFYLKGVGEWKDAINPFGLSLEDHIKDATRIYVSHKNLFGSKKLALAAYNQGFGKMRKALLDVAEDRGMSLGHLDTDKIVEKLRESGKGNGGYVQFALDKLEEEEGRKYPMKVLNEIGSIS